MEETKTPDEWQKELGGPIILDPDGWDRSNFDEDWAKPLTKEEFLQKRQMCTCMHFADGKLL